MEKTTIYKENNSLKEEVQKELDIIKTTNRYSMSKIYTLFNKVFNTNETPTTCPSYLIRKTQDLKKWLEDNNYTPYQNK